MSEHHYDDNETFGDFENVDYDEIVSRTAEFDANLRNNNYYDDDDDDIAGSTAMTQNLGDAGAQHVVRAHNRVVREALTMWNGKEVKHTGDGIMASFVKTSDSLDAAMQMQRESAEYTEQNPDKPLRLKIGINAGEPISEDNDLFGTTVQMSARIVDKAQADEIFVSEIVRGICAGKSYKFVNRGTYPMKGFETDPVLYELVWKE